MAVRSGGLRMIAALTLWSASAACGSSAEISNEVDGVVLEAATPVASAVAAEATSTPMAVPTSIAAPTLSALPAASTTPTPEPSAAPLPAATATPTGEPAATTSPEPTATAAPTPTATPRPGTLAAASTRPPGVTEAFEWNQAASNPRLWCRPTLDIAPQVVIVDEVLLLDTVAICLLGFDPQRTAEVLITSPTGRTLRPFTPNEEDLQASTADLAFQLWQVPADAETGNWLIRARQDDVSAQATVTVVLPEEPTVRVTNASRRLITSPGETLTVGLAGWPANTVPSIDVYLDPSARRSTYRYLTTIDPPRTDSRGIAVFTLPTNADTAPGNYCFYPHQTLTPEKPRPFGAEPCALGSATLRQPER